MNRPPLRWVAGGALGIAALGAALLRHVPPREIGVLQNRVGRSNPTLLEAGWHWRLPGWEAIYVYPRQPIPVRGEAKVTTRDKVAVRLPYQLEATLDEDKVLRAHREKAWADARTWLGERVESALRRMGTRSAAYLLLRESLPASLETPLRRDLERVGLVGPSLRVGPGKVAPEILAQFLPERLQALRRPTGSRVVVIGLDGADWDLALPMIERGELPNLARLRREGAYGKILTNRPALSPLLWTTVATGKSPDLHGINDFLVLDTETGRMVPISSQFRKVKAAWNIASDSGLTTEFVAWWASWPAEPIRGIMVSDRVSYSLFSFVEGRPPAGGETYPEGYLEEIRGKLKTEGDVTPEDLRPLLRVDTRMLDAARTPAGRQGERGEDLESLATLIRVVASTQSYRTIALDLLGRRQPDLFAVYFQGIDEVNHRYAHLAPPRRAGVSADRFERYSQVVSAFYRYQDRILGELLGALDPESTVMLLSDHGFYSGKARPKDVPPFISGRPGLWHAPYGVLVLWGKHVRPGPLPTCSLYDILPTLLDLLGLPPAEDLPGRSIRAALQPEFTGGASLERIASYEAYGDPRRAGPERESPPSGAAASEAMVETLRSLGYVGPAPAPAGTGAPGVSSTATTALYHANLASILHAKGDREGAEREYRLALESHPDTLSALLGLARLEQEMGRPDQALGILQLVVARRLPFEPALFLQIAELFHQTGKERDGLLYLDRTFPDRAGEPLLDTARGVLYSHLDQPDRAEAAFRAALARDPMALPPMEELFVLYDRQGRVPRLIPELEAAVRSEDGSFMHHNWLGLAYRREGDSAGAEREFLRALQLDPVQVGPAANLGSLYLQQGKVAEAAATLESGLSRDPASAEVRTNLIVAYGRLGQVEDARKRFEEGVQITPGRPSLYNAMAFVYRSAGNPGEAARLLRTSLQLDPHQKPARELLRQVDPRAAEAPTP